MSTRNRAYFFDTPATTAGAKLRSQNIPSETTFRDLLDSIAFKSEVGDYASEIVQGLVKLATDTVSKARSGVGVVLPIQLPVMTYGASNTELLTGNASYQGIKLTAVAKTNRLDYQVDFDPTSLSAKSTPTAADYLVIVDTADSNKPKKTLFSALPGQVWQDVATVISPATANDSLDMSGGTVTANDYYLKAAANAAINPLAYTGNNGTNLKVAGGAGQHASDPKTGGNLYLIGGAGVNAGLNGNVGLCWDGSTAVGNLGIRGAADTTYNVKVSGSVWVTGAVKHGGITPAGGGVIGGGAGPIVIDTNGVEYSPSFKQLMDGIVGSTVTAKSVLWFNGTSYTTLALGAVVDKYLRVNSSLNLEAADLVLTGKVIDASFSADNIVAWSRMANLTVSTIPSIGIGGVMQSSGVSSSVLPYIANLTSDAQAQITALAHNVETYSTITSTPALPLTAATIKASFIIDTSSGSVTVTLPLISTLIDGQKVEFNQYSTNPAILALNAGDTGFVTKLGADSAALTMSGAGGFVKLRCNAATKRWVVIAWI